MSNQLFINYSRSDIDFVRKLRQDLSASGFTFWIDTEQLIGGVTWVDEITKAIQECNAMITIFSPSAVASKWVQRELTLASHQNKPIIPIISKTTDIPNFISFNLGKIPTIDFSIGDYENNLIALLNLLKQILNLGAVTPDLPELIDSTGKYLFICYSRKEKKFAYKIEEDIREKGIKTWIDKDGIKGGDDWLVRVGKAIENCHALLAIISPLSLNSKWVRREMHLADKKEKQILPLKYKSCELPTWYEFCFSDLQWDDFTNGSYNENFNKLFSSLELVFRVT